MLLLINDFEFSSLKVFVIDIIEMYYESTFSQDHSD